MAVKALPASLPPGIEVVRLRRISPGLAFRDVRLSGVMLTGLRVEPRADGSLMITPPTRTDRNGRPWPIYSLQPGARKAVEMAIGGLWAASEAGAAGG